LLAQVSLMVVDTRVLDTAARLSRPSLHSLDAIHLASALELRDELTAFVAYDDRLLAAASALGMPIASPFPKAGAPNLDVSCR
jgi:predicted nucleic acid-binding protein